MPHHLVDQDPLNEERVRKAGITEIREGAWRFSSLPPFFGTSLDTSIIYHLKYKYMFMFKERQQ
jgi:hypothetical protein